MIIDYFPFFNERELLELRINLLKDHVDHFVICEANKTFTGIPKEFMLKRLIKELDLPAHMITVVELDVPADRDLPIEEHDITSMYPEDRGDVVSIMAMARDRAQHGARPATTMRRRHSPMQHTHCEAGRAVWCAASACPKTWS